MSILKDAQYLQKCSFLEKTTHHPLITLSEKGYGWINDILDEIIAGILPTARHFDLLKAQLWHLILLIEKEYTKNEKHNASLPSNNYTAAFIDLVGAELYRHHNVAFYADHLCITPNYLNKITKKALGVSASAYIQNRILSEAKILLKITELNVNEIAQSLGFESANYFIRFFKKNLGITPGEFRKNL